MQDSILPKHFLTYPIFPDILIVESGTPTHKAAQIRWMAEGDRTGRFKKLPDASVYASVIYQDL
jgi:3-hydroxymyristoyl/3-hydroxydecanoyl-(acyl carrier protein) dehydratase